MTGIAGIAREGREHSVETMLQKIGHRGRAVVAEQRQERNERHLKSALERQQFLVKEMNHRVKNSLTIVTSLLQMQARDADGKETMDQFEEAARRVRPACEFIDAHGCNPGGGSFGRHKVRSGMQASHGDEERHGEGPPTLRSPPRHLRRRRLHALTLPGLPGPTGLTLTPLV